MIEGSVWGGACDLALTCDLLVGSDTASFTVTPAKIGIPYTASGIIHFINVIGLNKAKEMFFPYYRNGSAERWNAKSPGASNRPRKIHH